MGALQDIPVPRVQAAVSASVADLGWTAVGIQSSVVNPRATASVGRENSVIKNYSYTLIDQSDYFYHVVMPNTVPEGWLVGV